MKIPPVLTASPLPLAMPRSSLLPPVIRFALLISVRWLLRLLVNHLHLVYEEHLTVRLFSSPPSPPFLPLSFPFSCSDIIGKLNARRHRASLAQQAARQTPNSGRLPTLNTQILNHPLLTGTPLTMSTATAAPRHLHPCGAIHNMKHATCDNKCSSFARNKSQISIHWRS